MKHRYRPALLDYLDWLEAMAAETQIFMLAVDDPVLAVDEWWLVPNIAQPSLLEQYRSLGGR